MNKNINDEETLLIPPPSRILIESEALDIAYSTLHQVIQYLCKYTWGEYDNARVTLFKFVEQRMNEIAKAKSPTQEMLEALNWAENNARILGTIAGNLPETLGGDKRAIVDVLQSIRDKSAAAIAKAEGRA